MASKNTDDDKKAADDAANGDAAAKAKAASDAATAARARVASGENDAANEPKPVVVGRTAQAEAAAQRNRSGSKEQVMVGCKLPHGLTITLDEKMENETGATVFQPTGGSVTLAGRNASQIIGGFGITPVDADFWDAWVAQHKNFKALKNGLIFAEPRQDRAMSRALADKDATTGTEAIDPDKPGKNLTRVSQEEQRRAAAMGDA